MSVATPPCARLLHGPHFGPVAWRPRCLPDNRQISGSVAFDGGEATVISGLVVEDRISFVWGALASPISSIGTNTGSGGGTFSGNVSAGTASGSLTIASTAATGTWTGHMSDKNNC